jgi:hypothetical protein
MKRVLFSLLIVAMLLVSAAPVFAADTTASKKNPLFALVGRITAIEGSTVTVNVLAGNPLARPYVGQTLDIQTTVNTRFLLKDADGTVAISLEDLAVDQNVSVQGKVVDGVWTATRITVGAAILHW